jgi:hypothetical protein
VRLGWRGPAGAGAGGGGGGVPVPSPSFVRAACVCGRGPPVWVLGSGNWWWRFIGAQPWRGVAWRLASELATGGE